MEVSPICADTAGLRDALGHRPRPAEGSAGIILQVPSFTDSMCNPGAQLVARAAVSRPGRRAIVGLERLADLRRQRARGG